MTHAHILITRSPWVIHYRYNIYLFIKALQKAKFSEFRIFAKIETRFIMYSAFSILRQNQILQNTKHMTKLMKMTKIGSKNPVFGSKTGVSEYSEYTEYS